MMKIKTILCPLAYALLLLSCNSNDNDIECADDFTGALSGAESEMAGTWALTAITSAEEVDITDDGESNPSQDIFSQYDDCGRDAGYTFGSNRAYEFNQGQNATDCDNSLTLSGTWKLEGQLLSLTNACFISEIPLQFNAEFTQFSSTTTQNVTEANGNIVQTSITFTYTKS